MGQTKPDNMSMYGTFVDITKLETIDEEDGHVGEVAEEEEENFVLTALSRAAEEGNLQGLEELLEKAEKVNINQKNRHGETVMHVAASNGQTEVIQFLQEKDADLKLVDKKGDSLVHAAARHGHLEVLKHLAEQGLTLNVQNDSGETPANLAARYGHVSILEYLCGLEIDLNVQDKLGDTPLHIGAWNGIHPRAIVLLCRSGAKPDVKNKDGETPLHVAASRGHIECVRILLSFKASLDLQDEHGSTALHLACKRRHTSIALVLLHAECSMDLQDGGQETPLHACCREGLLPIVQTMCAFGCRVDTVNKGGHSPLHLASRAGHTEIVRCLLLSGADPEFPNKDGITSEIMAIAQGHNDIAELLAKMRPDKRDQCVKQLLPGKLPLNRVKVKVFGNSGVGKSTIVESLKTGYFGSFFRKARLSTSGSTHSMDKSTAPKDSWAYHTFTWVNRFVPNLLPNISPESSYDHLSEDGEFEDVPLNDEEHSSSDPQISVKDLENGNVAQTPVKQHSLPTQLSFEVANEAYTKGINVEQCNVSGVGELSIWEFSGYEPYYMMYDLFIGDPNCIHAVTFSLADPQEVQLSQILFWLNFIKARMAPLQPIAIYGKQPWPAKVMLIATHADKVDCPRNTKGEYTSAEADLILANAMQKFCMDFDIYHQVFVVDSHLAMSNELKSIRNYLGDTKAKIVQNLPVPTGFLEAIIQALPNWRKISAAHPIVPWPSFIDYVRTKVNMLASEDHLKEVMCQLQLAGEVVYVEAEHSHDFVILDPKWLCNNLIGELLSHERLAHARPTGCFSKEDLEINYHLLLPEVETMEVLPLLEALEICTPCDMDGDVEYEFPCFNFIETLHGLWDKDEKRMPNPVYGGVRLQCPRGMSNQMMHLFPRVQTMLRRDILRNHNSPDCDLYQWYHGSKYCSGPMEALVTLEQNEQVIEIKCRGPGDSRTSLFYFFEDVYNLVIDCVEEMCPGLCIERHVLSPTMLKEHQKKVHAYPPKDILHLQLDGETKTNLKNGIEENICQLLCFGSQDVMSSTTLGVNLHISHLPVHSRRFLCMYLDPTESMGRDWCLLAVSLGLTEALPHLDSEPNRQMLPRSKTDRSLEVWSRDPNSTIGLLIKKLEELGRQDAADIVCTLSPFFHIYQDDNSNVPKTAGGPQSPSFESDNTSASR